MGIGEENLTLRARLSSVVALDWQSAQRLLASAKSVLIALPEPIAVVVAIGFAAAEPEAVARIGASEHPVVARIETAPIVPVSIAHSAPVPVSVVMSYARHLISIHRELGLMSVLSSGC